MASTSRTIKRNGTQIKRAVAYARFSSNNQREESITAQLRAINEYCEKNHIVLVDTFYDEAVSGKTDNRDEFQKMIKKVLKGQYQVDAILVHKFNRFARNKYDSALYKKRLRDIGVRVVSVTQQIDDSPEGEMLEGFIETIDQYYTANLSLEVLKGLKENALAGKHTGSKPVFGLSVDENGHYYPNENAHIVRRIFEEYASGVPKTAIVKRLNEEGYRNQFGRTFNTRTIYDLLRNEKYIGNYVYNLTHTETIRLDGIIKDPIIDNNLWERVHTVRSQPSKAKYREQKRFYYLTGKCHCKICGSNIAGAGSKKQKNGSIYSYYKCVGKSKHKNGCDNLSLNKEWFEDNVLKSIYQYILNDEAIQTIAKMAYDELVRLREAPPVDIKVLKKQLATIQSKQEKLTDLYLDEDSTMSKETYNKKNKALEKEKLHLEKEIEKNKKIEQSHNTEVSDIAQYLKEYKNKVTNSDLQNDDVMRILFNTFVEEIQVDKENIDITLKVSFDTLGGGMMNFGGAVQHIPPTILNIIIKRKSNVFGRNS